MVTVVVVVVEVLRHVANEGAVRVLANGPATHVGLTTLVGKEKVIILNVGAIHWLEGGREREREREREGGEERE